MITSPINSFLSVFKQVLEIIEAEKIPYMVVGSIASMAYGEPRLTKDMDIVIQIDLTKGLRLQQIFPPPHYYVPPIEILSQEIINHGQFNILHISSGLKVDFILSKNNEFSKMEFSRRVKVQLLHDFEVYLATAEDVILKKLAFFAEGNSHKHLEDIKGILVNTQVDHVYVEHWSQKLSLYELWTKILTSHI